MFLAGATQKIQDGTIYFRQVGTGPQTLILLHSVGSSSLAWEKVSDSLSRQYSLFALDMMGHGNSGKPFRDYTIPDYARSVVNFMEARSISQAILLGNSIGAIIAAEVAANFPRRVRALVLVGCPAWETEVERLERLKIAEAFFDERGLPKKYQLEDLAQSYFSPTPELLKWVNEGRAKAGVWVKKALEAVCRFDILPVLGKIDCPSLIMNGKQDLLRDKERVLLERIQGSRLAIVPEAGHLPQIDNPEGFLEAMKPFLDSVF